MYDLSNKTALITGAGQSVGLGIAQQFARSGAHILINDIVSERAQSVANALCAEGKSATALAFDVADADQVKHALNGTKVDILVNNVGNAGSIPMEQTRFIDLSLDTIRQVINSNLYGVIHCTQAVLPGMCDRGFGRVICIGSEAGRQGLSIGVSPYGAAKAAIANLVRHVALEVAASNVTCNTVSLGLMNNVPAEFTDAVLSSIPLGRLGTPDDAASMCLLLASDSGSWITGQEFVVNGGSSVRG
ncbi:MAG: SDR family NAD(P)-dependent oxidoreductase [Halioglobus sp.]|jgi:NAD(P)-dependent dehydrogenase (short-subunit alcohol dehydrogenase family)|tara:strand:+ start:78 stop:815 length:738 start_codon:yes stop_codon:yes gene_type:complete